MIGTLRNPLALALLLALAACQQSAPPAATSAPAKPAPTATAAAPATADSIGVPECDDYLSKYQACIQSKVPESARAGFKQSIDQTRAAWRNAAATAGGKEGLAAACKQARDSSKTAMAAYGCTEF